MVVGLIFHASSIFESNISFINSRKYNKSGINN